MQAISEVGLSPQANQRADTLSGGQQQRVAIARMLAQQPKITLADEPVSNLDPQLADDVLSLLTETIQSLGSTLIMTIHQPEFAKRYAERIIGLRDSEIVFDAPPTALTDAMLAEIYGDELEAVL